MEQIYYLPPLPKTSQTAFNEQNLHATVFPPLQVRYISLLQENLCCPTHLSD